MLLFQPYFCRYQSYMNPCTWRSQDLKKTKDHEQKGQLISKSQFFQKTKKNQPKGAFNNYVDKMRVGGGQKMSVFVHAQGIKTVHAGGVKK